MSNDIKVGDVCEFILPRLPVGEITRRYNGTQCTVLRLAIATGLFGVMHECEMFDGVQAKVAALFLRKNPPKQTDDVEPRVEHVPAEPDFVEDLQRRLNKAKATEPA